jgi:hypothetical protein
MGGQRHEVSEDGYQKSRRYRDSMSSRNSSVGIETRYGMDGPGSNTGEGEIFRTCPDRPWGPHSLLYNGYRVFPGGTAAGRGDDHPPHLGPKLKKEKSYTSTLPLGLRGLF